MEHRVYEETPFYGEVYGTRPRRPIKYFRSASGCYICTSHQTGSSGYPLIRRMGSTMTVARWIYMMENQLDNIESLVVMHTCDNRMCINPRHLRIGTFKDNEQDKISKGRRPDGDNSAVAKLSYKKVAAIRDLYDSGYTLSDLGEMFNVAFQTISSVVNYKTWNDEEALRIQNDPNIIDAAPVTGLNQE